MSEGATLVLTTQYLEEADRLADQIVVLDHGRVTAQGTPSELKARIGGERIEVTVADVESVDRTAAALAPYSTSTPAADPASPACVIAPVEPDTRLIEVVRALDAAGIDVTDVHRREATLDDVFLTLTGGRGRDAEPIPEEVTVS